MKLSFGSTIRALVAASTLVGAGAAQAHTGHGTAGLFAGLAHPFGLDHLLAMIAVGVWSVSALPEKKAWMGPATFMLALILGALLGLNGATVPYLEAFVSASVVLFGGMLVLSRAKWPMSAGLGLIAVAASFHGLAHGAETPASGFAAYAAGFLVTTAGLHFSGVLVGLSIRRALHDRDAWLVRSLGVACSGMGVYLMTQL